MPLLRISSVECLAGHRLRLGLTDGSIVERDIGALLHGPVFDAIRGDPARFRQVRALHGALVFAGDDGDEVDLCPDTVIWGGLPPTA